tara:strand:+ start:3952 stop:5733 length:1782 start_codon:yes stop_codon:yes gene_type:complete
MSQQETKDMNQHFYRASAADFMKIPGSPVAYWADQAVLDSFESEKLVGEIASVKIGMGTGKNEIFVREWWEVGFHDIDFSLKSTDDLDKSSGRYFPYNKGGDFRLWYGNLQQVLWFDAAGRAAMDRMSGHRENGGWNYYFNEGITWSFISSSKFGVRYLPHGSAFDVAGSTLFCDENNLRFILGFLSSNVCFDILSLLNPTLNYQAGNIKSLPIRLDSGINSDVANNVERNIEISREDWDSYETSWGFRRLKVLESAGCSSSASDCYNSLRVTWNGWVEEMRENEINNNRLLIEIYGLNEKIIPDVPVREITLTCNPHYRYGGNRSEEELEALLQCDTLRELVSYAIGCMMGRYSLDRPGLILASQGETLQDYLRQIPSPRFTPDDDAILPLTDQEWFADDATNRFSEFVRVVWGDEHLQENLDFVAESLCLHAIKPKRGESALDTIRRYLSTQFYKDHLRTYKKRPIYWLFSSGKHKAFECLVYLHRYNEGTLARMRTEYVIPLSAKLNAYAEKLEQDKDASSSAAETKRLEKEIATLHKQQTELAEFDEKLRHYADQRISLDLDDGVKVNYGKFGDLLAEVKAVTGEKPSD